jgi:hypothetical protein
MTAFFSLTSSSLTVIVVCPKQKGDDNGQLLFSSEDYVLYGILAHKIVPMKYVMFMNRDYNKRRNINRIFSFFGCLE